MKHRHLLPTDRPAFPLRTRRHRCCAVAARLRRWSWSTTATAWARSGAATARNRDTFPFYIGVLICIASFGNAGAGAAATRSPANCCSSVLATAEAGADGADARARLRVLRAVHRPLRWRHAIYIAAVHGLAGQVFVAEERRRRRGSVQRESSSACSKSGSRCRCSRATSIRLRSSATDGSCAPRRVCSGGPLLEISALFQGFAVVLSPFNMLLMIDRHRARRHHRRAARPGRRQRRRDPAAADVHDAADLGDHHAVVHLLGRAVRRRDHVDPVQHSGRALVGGDHLRRLSAGAARAAPAKR